MLPFTKRTARSEESSELIHTGDIEVVRTPAGSNGAKRPSAFPPASERPRVFARSASDDDMTTLLPRKGMTFNVRSGAAPVTPVPMPKRISSNPPRATLEEPPTRQFIKPSSPPPSISPVAGPPRSNRPAPPAAERAVLAGRHARAALKPQPVPQIADSRKSDPRIDPPATVITARTRVVAARPTISWAAALVAMGVFVGLVTAVVARGDADTLIDAAASFVDPSGGHVAASGSMASSIQTKASETHTNVVASPDTLVADTTADVKVASWESPSASATPMPARPAPVAYAAPVHHSAPRAVAHAAPAKEAKEKEERVASNSPKAAPAPKAASLAKLSKASDDDVESASAADALAKAQLEASLR